MCIRDRRDRSAICQLLSSLSIPCEEQPGAVAAGAMTVEGAEDKGREMLHAAQDVFESTDTDQSGWLTREGLKAAVKQLVADTVPEKDAAHVSEAMSAMMKEFQAERADFEDLMKQLLRYFWIAPGVHPFVLKYFEDLSTDNQPDLKQAPPVSQSAVCTTARAASPFERGSVDTMDQVLEVTDVSYSPGHAVTAKFRSCLRTYYH
eukprot:TRINITY_DN21050_c0_g1_i2.p2 TRINITY_DN21050_c0_g1~~TRINITY_DN21050_c0_g1_i2.p2  ORF type:complete len:205 (+),score=49.92 TRINITY_DN21050_c0_g1_i2:191-805(+)